MDRSLQPRMNVADRLAEAARERPDAIALAAAKPSSGWETITFGEIDRDATLAARGLAAMGVGPGKRIALLVKPSVEFVTLVFALLRTGATMVLVDAGLGRKNIVRCLASTEPDGFVAIPLGHALRVVKRKQFAKAKLNVTVGRRWFWGGETLASLRKLGQSNTPSPLGGGARGGGTVSGGGTSVCAPPGLNNEALKCRHDDGSVPPSPNPSLQGRGATDLPHTTATDPAAIVFTSGSTGPPKGVLYTHETFVTHCAMIQAEYDIRPGDIDLACFPLFGLFNVACGVTVVLPDMDFSRPASCDPKKILAAANEWKVTQAFASPAVWDRVSRYCESTGERIPTLKKILSCGAPVPAKVLRRTLACVHPDAQMHTPYGATEALPIATIEAQEILGETAAKTDAGAGVCVGKKFGTRDGGRGTRGNAEGGLRIADSMDGEPSTVVGGGDFEWRVIRITDTPIATIDETEELPTGEIGELIVRGPQVSSSYHFAHDPTASIASWSVHNVVAKIHDGDTIWHRMGDVGYFDAEGRFWYCGRKSQRVVTSNGTLYTECVEGRVNSHPYVRRSALTAVGPSLNAAPCVFFEADTDAYERLEQDQVHVDDLCLQVESHIASVLSPHRLAGVWAPPQGLPTDIRHNSKIRREELAVWAAKELAKRRKT
ncbi:AMP-binding protein [Botrimarina mediterranea]|uniref:AMP-binding protein n=1 Tax=Botrimarina mediterranea TaxID=2528022 RepID=UPI001187CF18|nr:4-chlorobenzoate--CoA ligase [Planctomycetes bacterium K2D]